jgi:hypothetical protein
MIGPKNTNTGNLGDKASNLDFKAGEDGKKGGSRMKGGSSNPKPFTERAGTQAGD